MPCLQHRDPARPLGLRSLQKRFAFCITLAAGCLLQACLISPPEPLPETEQIAPRIFVHEAVPSTFALIQTTSTGPQPTFRAVFTSEDLGEKVVGKLYLNLDHDTQNIIGSVEVGPGTLEEERELVVPWQQDRASSPAGCYLITMTITQQSNYSNDVIPLPIDRDMTDYITWWVAHDTSPEDLSGDECPQPSPDLNQQAPPL